MDPFSALTIATSTIQIVDFSLKLIHDVQEIHKRGSVERVDKIVSVVEGIKELSQNLENGLSSGRRSTDLTDNERVSGRKVSLYCHHADKWI